MLLCIGLLKRAIRKELHGVPWPINSGDLFDAIFRAFRKIESWDLTELAADQKRRLQEVIDLDGWQAPY